MDQSGEDRDAEVCAQMHGRSDPQIGDIPKAIMKHEGRITIA